MPTGSRERPPNYRLLLHNDDFNVREYVVQVLLKVVPVISIDIAVSVMVRRPPRARPRWAGPAQPPPAD